MKLSRNEDRDERVVIGAIFGLQLVIAYGHGETKKLMMRSLLDRFIRECTRVEIGWKPPSDNFVRLNTDGARKDNNKAECGGIIRGNHGEWLGGFAKVIGECSAFIAELWGVFEGLTLARRMGFRKVEVHIDSVVVVQVITTGKLHNKIGWSLVLNIRKLLELDWEVIIAHAYRETNKCADALANVGCQLNRTLIFYEDCP
ncbi:hypothetical protein TSUD_188010 [Trifolium subterraneum]|uniref:RNase H type-1 domain-containing protein n=1 Tax=Trifolium subterraneum TaxID=3900 RepID=A0A2Z6P4T0_TRISU|nr:hypothetical protein TSUD_188010 [Trifolium subterraneum]